MKINILTIFPEMFAPLRMSMLGRAIDNGIIELNVTDIRDYTTDKHNRVDDTPYGGGAGMVMQVQPILDAFNGSGYGGDVIYMSPRGEMLSGDMARELSRKDVRVIPTKNVAMGIASAIAFQNDLSPDENVGRMTEAAQHVKTAMVTYAIRDSEYNGIAIKQGDIIGLHNGQIEFSGHSVHDVVLEMMKKIITDEDELVTVYFGSDVSEEDAKAITAEIENEYDYCDVECHNGGQPLYYYLISVE